MKARPRRIEREVARCLSTFFLSLNLDEVERKPVTGRTGPDVTYNKEFKLIVDVKSRLEVPKGVMTRKEDELIRCPGEWIGCQLDDPKTLLNGGAIRDVKASKLVTRWLVHMDEWTAKNEPEGITALVLHRPGMEIKRSLLLIKLSHLRRFHEYSNNRSGD